MAQGSRLIPPETLLEGVVVAGGVHASPIEVVSWMETAATPGCGYGFSRVCTCITSRLFSIPNCD